MVQKVPRLRAFGIERTDPAFGSERACADPNVGHAGILAWLGRWYTLRLVIKEDFTMRTILFTFRNRHCDAPMRGASHDQKLEQNLGKESTPNRVKIERRGV